MTLQKLQRFAPWLVGLFLIAQLAGMIPALYMETLHDYKSAISHAQEKIVSGKRIREHDDRGALVGHDQCCALHHGMIGVISFVFGLVVTSFVHLVPEAPTSALVSGDPTGLDRPPRPLPSN